MDGLIEYLYKVVASTKLNRRRLLWFMDGLVKCLCKVLASTKFTAYAKAVGCARRIKMHKTGRQEKWNR